MYGFPQKSGEPLKSANRSSSLVVDERRREMLRKDPSLMDKQVPFATPYSY